MLVYYKQITKLKSFDKLIDIIMELKGELLHVFFSLSPLENGQEGPLKTSKINTSSKKQT